MSTYILTSMFANGFHQTAAEQFQQILTKRNTFAFVASAFENASEKTDGYFAFFLDMFAKIGIRFEKSYVIDGRMTATEAQKAVEAADVVWLAGGDTPVQFRYLQEYGLDTVIRQHRGVIIGMSAGAINMGETAICTLSCGHDKREIYPAIGCVQISVEPHFVRNEVSDELLEISKTHTVYGLCDEALIVCTKEKTAFYGEIYKIENGKIERVST